MKYNNNFHKWAAMAFENIKHNPNDKETKRAYQALKCEVALWCNTIRKHVRIKYSNESRAYNQLVYDISQKGVLWVYPTSSGFGDNDSIKYPDNPLLDISTQKIDNKPAPYNDLFRAFHDYYGHYKGKFDFTKEGEEKAYRFHCGQLSDLAIKALTTETRGQNSWVHWGPFADHNKTARGEKTIHAEQKTGLLPEWCSKLY